jgi:hypothetical protein
MEKDDTEQKDHDEKGGKGDSVKGNRAWLWRWGEEDENEDNNEEDDVNNNGDKHGGKGSEKERSHEEVVVVGLILGLVSSFRSLKFHQITMNVQKT